MSGLCVLEHGDCKVAVNGKSSLLEVGLTFRKEEGSHFRETFTVFLKTKKTPKLSPPQTESPVSIQSSNSPTIIFSL